LLLKFKVPSLWLWFFLALMIVFPAWAASFEITSPQDHLVTYDEVVMLKGRATGYSTVKVNGNTIDIGYNGRFSAGLFLTPGKNYVSVEFMGRGGQKKVVGRKILYLLAPRDILELKKSDPTRYSIKPIIYLTTLGVIEAYPDNNFSPKGWLLKGEFATWICKLKGIRTVPPEDDPAYDVPREHWRAPFIKACLDRGYMEKYSEELFGMNDGMLRSAAVKTIMRLEEGTAPAALETIFSDVPVVHTDAKEIYAAWKKRWIEGISKRYRLFDPDRYITREEAATLLARLPSLKGKISNLVDFSSGYGAGVFAQVNTPPKIVKFLVEPQTVSAAQSLPVLLKAEIADRQGYADVSTVKVDLSSLGGPPDALLIDTGENGDVKANDAVFTLQIAVSVEAVGNYGLKVTAMDRKGWEGEAYNSLTVTK
jgi:hypothetical protein